MQVNIGTKVVAAKDTRHGIVKKGTVGVVVATNDYDEAMKCPTFTVEFPGHKMRFLFANDKTAGRKIQIHRDSFTIVK